MSLTVLNIDQDLFQYGIHKGELIHVRGSINEKHGKSILLNYFIASFLVRYPTKKAALINNGCSNFSLEVIVKAIYYGTEQRHLLQERKSWIEIMKNHSEIMKPYLDRLFIHNCFTCHDLYLTVGVDEGRSYLYRLIQQYPEISIIFIDSIDSFPVSNSYLLENREFDILTSLRMNNVNQLPIICTTKAPFLKFVKKDTMNENRNFKYDVVVNPSKFTHTLTISIATDSEKRLLPEVYKKLQIYCSLWRQGLQPMIHKALFSIQRDMVLVDRRI